MISILIPIYNGIEFIEESVSSVLNQTMDQWEIIIGVNGHLENSEVYKIAKEYENRSSHNKIRVYDFYWLAGKSITLNEMLKYCSYSYIAILDVDDIWIPNKLETQVALIDKYDVIGSRCIYIGDINGIVPNIPIGDLGEFDFTTVNPIINSSAIIRKELCYWFKQYDGIEDYELWLRLKYSGKTFYNFSKILVKHRIHKQSAFNSKGNGFYVNELVQKYKSQML